MDPAALDEVLADSGLESAGLAIANTDRVLYTGSVGGFDPDRRAHIWSSTKWLTAATVMALVDRSAFALDDPVSRHLSWFGVTEPAKRSISLRHCLSLTSGLGGSNAVIMDGSTTLEEAVRAIEAEPLHFLPGTTLDYGGNGFHVVGLVAEAATGRPFATLFDELVATPLGMTATTYGSEPTKNPWLGGGAWSTLADLTRFVVGQLPRADMRRVHTTGCAIAGHPYPGTERPYGLGVWLDEVDGDEGVVVSSQGAAGCTPWIDVRSGTAGCLLTEASYLAVYPSFRRIIDLVRH